MIAKLIRKNNHNSYWNFIISSLHLQVKQWLLSIGLQNLNRFLKLNKKYFGNFIPERKRKNNKSFIKFLHNHLRLPKQSVIRSVLLTFEIISNTHYFIVIDTFYYC